MEMETEWAVTLCGCREVTVGLSVTSHYGHALQTSVSIYGLNSQE